MCQELNGTIETAPAGTAGEGPCEL
jgi:hypothetical protein